MFTFFVTRRFLFSKKDSKSFSFFSTIAIAGIAIGVATLIISISILQGFEKLLTEKLINLDSHIQIVGFSNNQLPLVERNMATIKRILGTNLDRIEPYVASLGIINKKGMNEGITLKGVKPDYFERLKDVRIIEGRRVLTLGKNEMIIGKTLASKLFIKTGDKVNIFALKNNQVPSAENPPAIEKFEVAGIFESGLAKYDNNFAYIDIENASYLFGFGENISGYEIKLNNITSTDSLTNLLQESLRYPHYVTTVFQIYRHIFTWIELQKKPIPIVLALIIIVAIFNIVSTLLMVVMEKTSAIGVFKSLGVSKRKINMIFLQHGIFIGFLGVAAGNLLAFVLIRLQLSYSVITLPAEIYFTSEVPLILNPEIFLLVSVLSFILAVVVAILPSSIASRISAISTLRFN
ncbi:MAG: ABC transporter permease [Ignavibacteriaceae bacterium]